MQNDQFLEFAAAFDQTAKYVFLLPQRAENLLAHFSTALAPTPDEIEILADSDRVQHAFALKRHAEVVRKISEAPQIAESEKLIMERDALQIEIAALAPKLNSPGKREAIRRKHEQASDARIIWDCMFNAVRDGTLAIYLKPDVRLQIQHFEDPRLGTFIPAESVGEFAIAGKGKLRGIVAVQSAEFTKWLATVPKEDGELKTPEMRIAKAKQLLEILWRDQEKKTQSQDAHFATLKDDIPNLRRTEFDTARKAVADKPEFEWVRRAGRRPKSPQK